MAEEGRERGEAQERGGALLRIHAPVPQTHTHLDQHARLVAEGDHGHRQVREEVCGRQMGGQRQVGACIQTGPIQLAGKKRKRKEGIQEHDADVAAHRTGSTSNTVDRTVNIANARNEQANNSSLEIAEVVTAHRETKSIEEEQGGRKVP